MGRGVAQPPNIDAYPRNAMLGDGTTLTLRPAEENDKLSLLDFSPRVSEEDRSCLKEIVNIFPS